MPDRVRFQFNGSDQSSTGAIHTAELLAALRAGHDVVVRAATIRGPFILKYETLSGEITIQDCVIEADLDATGASFERPVDFSGSQFLGRVDLSAATFKSVASFERTSFSASSQFSLARFCLGAIFSQATFQSSVTFWRAAVEHVMKMEGIKIFGTLDCRFLKIDGDLHCWKLESQGGPANFEGMVVTGDATLFGSNFNGHVNFSHVMISGVLDLQDANFLGTLEQRARDNVKGGDSFFGMSVGGLSRFERARFTDSAGFSEVTFGSDAYFGVNSATTFESEATFLGTRFMGEAHFSGVAFRGPVKFGSAEFQKRVVFAGQFDCDKVWADFIGAHFLGDVVFDALFRGGISFAMARFDRHFYLGMDCSFEKTAVFRNTTIYSLIWVTRDGHVAQPFKERIDLRGCVYRKISYPGGLEQFWELLRTKTLIQTQKKDEAFEYESQPYLYLEQVCRRVGQKKLADNIYFERRKMDTERETRLIYKAWDRLERVIFGYGVKPEWMICWFISILVLGALVFRLAPRAMIPIDLSGAAAQFSRTYSSIVLSATNLVPGIEQFSSHFGAWAENLNSAPILIWALFQRLVGWVLLAMLVRRFFGGLKPSDGADDSV